MKRIGLFGGTFDPIHNGHLHIARAFADELALDSVVFIPAGDPYHKAQPTTTPAQHRLHMVELAITEEPRFAVSDCDILREGATYTFDTVSIFRQAYPQAQLWWLMGMDSLVHIHTWHHYQALLRQVNLAVAQRGNANVGMAAADVQRWLPEALDKAQQQPEGIDGGRIHWLNAVFLPVSATEIRKQWQAQQTATVGQSVPDKVVNYFIRNHLYQI